MPRDSTRSGLSCNSGRRRGVQLEAKAGSAAVCEVSAGARKRLDTLTGTPDSSGSHAVGLPACRMNPAFHPGACSTREMAWRAAAGPRRTLPRSTALRTATVCAAPVAAPKHCHPAVGLIPWPSTSPPCCGWSSTQRSGVRIDPHLQSHPRRGCHGGWRGRGSGAFFDKNA
jgi:hypothetical protein